MGNVLRLSNHLDQVLTQEEDLSQKVVPKSWFVPVFGLIVVTLMAIAPAGPSVVAESTPTPVPNQPGPGGQAADVPRVGHYARDNDIKFERFSTERGLSSGVVFCILQDSRGFIWFGTQDGLNKYDGYTFTVYRHSPEDIHSLSDDTVWTIYEDRAGVLWIGTDKGGLNSFDRDQGRFVH